MDFIWILQTFLIMYSFCYRFQFRILHMDICMFFWNLSPTYYLSFKNCVKIINLKKNKGLVHFDQPKYLFNILLFHYFLSDYLKKEEEENEMSVWPNLYIDQGGTSQPLSPLCLNPTTNMLFHALSYRILENPILDFFKAT